MLWLHIGIGLWLRGKLSLLVSSAICIFYVHLILTRECYVALVFERLPLANSLMICHFSALMDSFIVSLEGEDVSNYFSGELFDRFNSGLLTGDGRLI